ncbi:MAG: hypothetical protein AB7K68_00370 [Bacteriovoracia bacterium]
MKALNLKTLVLVSLLTLPSLNALACQGGSCGGGGSVIKGMTLDTYLQKNTAAEPSLKPAWARN